MKTAFIVLLGLLALPPTGTCTATAEPIDQWGDFTVRSSAFTLDVWAFDRGLHTNPELFPPPTSVGSGYFYPEQFFFSPTLTVDTLREYCASVGAYDYSLGLLFKTGGKVSILYALSMYVGGTRSENIVAHSGAWPEGAFIMRPYENYVFMTHIDLNKYDADASMTIAYVGGISSSIDEVKLAHSPEPLSMALLGTGFVALVAARLRRRRRWSHI